MDYWFYSDPHFFHKNILKFCNRPFEDVIEMNESIIYNHNNVVKDNDIVYCLGDVSFGSLNDTIKILERLNGKKHLIFGNHDKQFKQFEKFKNKDLASQFESMSDYLEIEIGKKLVCIMHYPIASWRNRSHKSYHLHGHTHGSLELDGKAFDCGLDNVAKYLGNGELLKENYRPINSDEIKIIMDSKSVYREINMGEFNDKAKD